MIGGWIRCPRLMAFNYLNSPLRDESRSFPKAEGFNPRGCCYFLDHLQAGVNNQATNDESASYRRFS
jgi:hypothetical protein